MSYSTIHQTKKITIFKDIMVKNIHANWYQKIISLSKKSKKCMFSYKNSYFEKMNTTICLSFGQNFGRNIYFQLYRSHHD